MLWFLSILTVLIVPSPVWTAGCSRYPSNTFTPKSPVDENFVVSIGGNPQTYILGQEYNVSINAFNGLRFVSFMLALENENGNPSYNDDLGHFEITDAIETRYSPQCVNMVENTNTNPKTHVHTTWVAPDQPGSGCVLIRATLLQHRDVWYMDDGGLTKRICEEVTDDVESQSRALSQRPCCACDEARYELIFEGVWSRNLHPRDFPTKGWMTRFSDILGAAHTADYRFWEYGALATEALREFAQYGSARLLEKEFNMNFKDGKIRTIIKSRGPAFPNLNGQSIASVRVDPQHHFVSLASKIDPSPDWIVGVSGLELCMANCTWLEHKFITLYPWDIGTDAGPSYTSPDQPQVPPDVIRRMRSDFPNDPRSPFYDETGAPMKPLATLTIRRQRIYERQCEDEDSNNVDTPRECITHPWTPWTECTAKCGEGRQYRTRVYKQPNVAKIYNCDALMVNRQDRTCMGSGCGELNPNQNPSDEVADIANTAYGSGPVSAECQLTAWSTWSGCSKTCGEGQILRRRQYVNPSAEEKCQNARFVKLYDFKRCFGSVCLGEIPGDRRNYVEQDRANSMYNANELDVHQYGNEEIHQDSENQPEWSYANAVNPVGPFGNEGTEIIAQNENDNMPYGSNFEIGNLNKFDSEYQSNVDRFKIPQQQNSRNQQLSFVDTTERQHNAYRPKSSLDVSELTVPAYCFEPLQVFTCLETTVTGNFWFYNYCEDECMLYATDSCDRNDNKFSSLEMCELRCRRTDNAAYLRRKQLQDCHKPKIAGNRRRKNRKGF